MAKFVYRMQSILDIKYKLEEQEKTAFGIASQRLQEENQKLQQLMLRRMEYEKRAGELAVGKIDVRAIHENKHAIDVMKTMIRDQITRVHVAEKNVELARNRLNAVMVERKAHEKLREIAFEEFQAELAAEEAKEIDQLVSFTYHDRAQQE
ncbi:MAG: flagellar export protein FliJ [Lachnospiraceae bacterium]|nr:flagellar export protein FliJ [bacterium]MDY5516022.1 flagellar export protein FliJ [Lachnospiraceae bacterium]